MSIAVIAQVYDEVRRLAIAGSVVAPGDFRLKKLVAPLEQAGQKAPVFVKVAEAVTKLVESSEKTSSEALLDLSTLVGAILYTQGETGVDGKLHPVKTTNLGMQKTQASARLLKPLLEALTTTGSGRLEIIRDAYERGSFRDLRLISPALAALDDSYSEISELVAKKILPLYGQAIVPELIDKFQVKGRGGHVRRLQLLHRLDPNAARPLVKLALEEGSKEVRVAAIECLGQQAEDLPFLLEQAKSRTKDVRAAALRGLTASSAKDAVEVLCKAIEGSDLSIAAEPLRTCENPTVRQLLCAATTAKIDELLSGSLKDNKKLGQAIERSRLLLECFRGRTDKDSEKLIQSAFAKCAALAGLKAQPSGTDLVETLVSLMVVGSPGMQKTLVAAHTDLPAESLGEAFAAACRAHPPQEVFAMFSPYLTAKVDEKKKARDPAYAKREVLINRIVHGRQWWYYERDTMDEFDILHSLSPQWLDLAVKLQHPALVLTLAAPGHAPSAKMLLDLFNATLAKSKDLHAVSEILSAMIRANHPAATDCMVAAIEKRAKLTHSYGFYWIGQLITLLPAAEAVPKLEALLAKLPEKIIDQLMDYLVELKSRGTSV
ncbi:MAG: HEAT repeat domain-containing protein [Pirellulaceae bacterium]